MSIFPFPVLFGDRSNSNSSWDLSNSYSIGVFLIPIVIGIFLIIGIFLNPIVIGIFLIPIVIGIFSNFRVIGIFLIPIAIGIFRSILLMLIAIGIFLTPILIGDLSSSNSSWDVSNSDSNRDLSNSNSNWEHPGFFMTCELVSTISVRLKSVFCVHSLWHVSLGAQFPCASSRCFACTIYAMWACEHNFRAPQVGVLRAQFMTCELVSTTSVRLKSVFCVHNLWHVSLWAQFPCAPSRCFACTTYDRSACEHNFRAPQVGVLPAQFRTFELVSTISVRLKSVFCVHNLWHVSLCAQFPCASSRCLLLAQFMTGDLSNSNSSWDLSKSNSIGVFLSSNSNWDLSN